MNASVDDPSGTRSPGKVVDLAVLGVASERARSQRELLAAVRHIGGGRFQPTTEVVAGRIAALVEAGLLGRRSAGGPRRPAGRICSACC